MNLSRDYYTETGYKPFLFYVVFGVSGEELQVSKEKHHVEEFPAGLEMQVLTRKNNAEYMDGFFTGNLGSVLQETNSELFENCKKAKNCVIIKGEILDDSTFNYMKDTIGFIQAFIDQGACGVLDLLTFSLMESTQWSQKFFEQEINAQNHAVILLSKENEGFWLHTRGMAEFGRPDISIKNISEDLLQDYKQIIDQMIFYGGQGATFNGKIKVHTYSQKQFWVNSDFVNDFQNDDFNNAYYNVVVLEEIKE